MFAHHSDPRKQNRQPSPAVATCIARVVQGDGDLKHLTALQELRIGTDAAVHTFNLHLDSLPPSLRRLSVSHGVEPPYGTPKLLAIAPPTVPETRPGASEPSRARLVEPCKAAAAQHPAPALPELLSLVMHCPRIVLPAAASVPLAASCAITVETVNFTVVQSGDHSPNVRTDRARVRSCPPLQLAQSSRVVLLRAAANQCGGTVHDRSQCMLCFALIRIIAAFWSCAGRH